MAKETFALTTSRGFESWLHRSGGSIAFTTYQAGKLFLIGLRPDGRIAVFERTFSRCMGLAVSTDARTLLLATQYQLYRFENALPQGELQNQHDAVYVPRLSWITGDLDIHDVGFGADGSPAFVNTLFSCLAQASAGWSFKPLWRPHFITKLAPPRIAAILTAWPSRTAGRGMRLPSRRRTWPMGGATGGAPAGS
jgi:uncharacterized protein (TIGR03032 family)